MFLCYFPSISSILRKNSNFTNDHKARQFSQYFCYFNDKVRSKVVFLQKKAPVYDKKYKKSRKDKWKRWKCGKKRCTLTHSPIGRKFPPKNTVFFQASTQLVTPRVSLISCVYSSLFHFFSLSFHSFSPVFVTFRCFRTFLWLYKF